MSRLRHTLPFSLLLSLLPLAAQETPAPRVDAHGDPIPDGARFRLGNIRLRDGGSMWRCALSADGMNWAVIDTDGKLRVWDVVGGRRRYSLTINSNLLDLTFSPTGRFLAFLSVKKQERTLNLLEAATGKELRLFNVGPCDRNEYHGRIAFSADDRYVTVNRPQWPREGTIQVWETATGKSFGIFKVLQDRDAEGVVSPDGKLLATWGGCSSVVRLSEEGGDYDRTVQVWEVAGRTEHCRLVAAGSSVTCVAFAPDGRSLAVATETYRTERHMRDTAIQIWEVATARPRLQLSVATTQPRARLSGWEADVGELTFSPDGRMLASATHEGVIHCWDLTMGQRRATAAGLQVPEPRLQFTSDGRLLAWRKSSTGFHMRAPNLWDVMTGKRLTPEDGHLAVVDTVAFIEDGASLATADRHGLLLTWDARTGKLQRRVQIEPESARTDAQFFNVRLAPKGQLFLASGRFAERFQTTRMWRLPELRAVSPVDERLGPGELLAVSPDGAHLIAQGEKEEVQLWRLESGKPLPRPKGLLKKGRREYLNGVSFSSDGKRVTLAVETDDEDYHPITTELITWDTASGKELLRWPAPPGSKLLGATPDDSALITHFKREVRVLAPATGQVTLTLEHKFWRITAPLAFAPDGRSLVVCSRAKSEEDGRIQIWELATGKLRRELTGHRGEITAAAFSPDGRSLATGGRDSTVLLWDLTARDRRE